MNVSNDVLARVRSWLAHRGDEAAVARMVTAGSLPPADRAGPVLAELRVAGVDPRMAGGMVGLVVDDEWRVLGAVERPPGPGRRRRALPDDTWAARLAAHAGLSEREVWTMIREQGGLSKSELARRIGVKRWKVVMWEDGQSVPNATDHPLLLEVLRPHRLPDQVAA